MLYSHGRIGILERFNDKYACDEMLGVYKYGRSNSVILKEAIKDYDKLDEAGQDKQILENFTHIKRVVDYSDEKLVDAIRNEEIKLYEYEYLLKTPGFSNITIALLVKYDVIKMINKSKSDWNMKDVTDIFRNRKKDVMQIIMIYTGDSDPKSKRNEKIFKRLYEEDTYTDEGKLKESAAEVNQINELWLEKPTEREKEIIISASQNKGIQDYRIMLSKVFSEIKRVLKDSSYAAVVFHAAKAQIWSAFEDAVYDSGLNIELTNILDKKQSSFKQVVSEASVQGDPLLLLSKRIQESSGSEDEEDIMERIILAMNDGNIFDERRAYSLYVNECLRKNIRVTYDAKDAYVLLRQLRKCVMDAALQG